MCAGARRPGLRGQGLARAGVAYLTSQARSNRLPFAAPGRPLLPMIYRDKILAALESRRDDFAIFEDELRKQYAVYRAALLDGAALSVAGLSARLTASDSVGALPLEDFSGGSAVSPFGREWKNHDEARAWAFETLL